MSAPWRLPTLAEQTAARLEKAGFTWQELEFVAQWNNAMRGFHQAQVRTPDCGWPSCPHRGRCP